MQTIQTKYLPATNYKPARVKATCQGGSVTISREYALNVDQDYVRVAKLLKDKMKWTGDMIGGHTDQGMVFVFKEDTYRI